MSARWTGRRWPWLVLVALLSGGLFVAATDDGAPPTPEERVRAVAESIACPVCDGQSVADSNAPTAQAIRLDIARRLEAGESPDEIRTYLSSRFDQDLLLTPPRTGVSSLVWFLPVAMLVGAIGGLIAAFRYWRASDDLEVPAEDQALVAAALADDDT